MAKGMVEGGVGLNARCPTTLRVLVLGLLLLIFILNQADRQLLPVLISGGLKCNSSAASQSPNSTNTSYSGVSVSAWFDVSGLHTQGDADADCLSFSDTMEGLLKGPTFTVIYATAGVVLAYLGDRHRRSLVLAVAAIFWSLTTAALYFIQSFWQLMLLRFALGLGEAVYSPVAITTIAALHEPRTRGTAMAIFYTGVYIGGGMGYIAGAVNERFGWRRTFLAFGLPGLVLGCIYAVAARRSDVYSDGRKDRAHHSFWAVARVLWRSPYRLVFVLMCFAAAVRNVAGYALGAYFPSFFRERFDLDDDAYAHTMVAMGIIVTVGGSCGSLIGGRVSDKLSRVTTASKCYIIAVSQVKHQTSNPMAAMSRHCLLPYDLLIRL
ncbi:uncharacterized protein MONBRDRAFT_27436 [Monosiga brevicollis MX1]|uniref:Major facilitator superfamily (MFS) profile domain-containing protein n=1 Tax=Monosiga brevicollis TaxID=81824 RepID=A9V597_MONBE|nr:uncharacterized protein MONBRDRAFT_27436 [Monosiga brevicollis MX1]EDQ87239.1 predicted protein [Monosiga brevicollis MX1]|eukprot:XP_001747852.1 hypothetical protein [Monosiga brevicollis MX1]